MSRPIHIVGGDVLDSGGRRRADVLVDLGEIVAVGDSVDQGIADALELNASGCLVTPGLVDMHVHLREPGGERAETIDTGGKAAALGGFTAVCAMANTDPVVDSASVVRFVTEAARRSGWCDVIQAGAITMGLLGERLAALGELADEGVRFFSDDGRCVADAEIMRRALEYLSPYGAVVSNHAEDPSLVGAGRIPGEREGVIDEGAISARLGLPGRPWVAEAAIVARDLLLAEITDCRLHVPHVSTAASVRLIEDAKARGIAVTAEVTPHHLVLTSAACETYDPVFRVNPPLRTQEDAEILREALASGVIDAVATDHAPHADEEKERPFEEAPPGIIGMETAVGVMLSEFVHAGTLGIENLVAAMSWKPAEILGLNRHGGPIEKGRPANLAVIDPNNDWIVDLAEFAGKSRNSPYAGRRLTGRVRHTIFEGRPVVIDTRLQQMTEVPT